MNIDNVELCLRENHHHRILLNYRTVKKFYLRVALVQLDIRFLKSCRTKDIIPKFLWFKTANRNLAASPAYKNSQRRLLNAEINYKYKHLNKLKKMYQYSVTVLQQYCPGDLFERLQQIITLICCPLIKTKEQDIEEKLHRHLLRTAPKHTVDPTVVTNQSTRILSNDEIDCLANGLDYGLVPKRFDEMNAVGNIEQFFHRVTDIYQHHKKFMKDLRDNDKIIPNDIRVLNTNEMTLASHLRSLTDTFRHQADRYRQKQYQIRGEQKQYYKLLKLLKQDNSIVVTRPDKGRGIVLMNKSDYLSKMHAILSDSAKFSCLFDDPTITRESSLMRLLNRLKNNGHISLDFWSMAKPIGSTPGRLYGLPKIHKQDKPLRPVLSSIGTYNYGLAKALKKMLSKIIRNEAVIKDTFAFVNQLRSLPKSASKYKMVSFDISSLYTNIPLNETIEIILKYLYDENTPRPSMDRKDFKKLLEFATKNSHFLFDGKMYDQIDGVSMGSPLAPLLAEIFLQDFEKKHLELFDLMGIGYWKRYVDDTFVLIDPKADPKDVCNRLSLCHPSIKFTIEKENLESNSIPFLDALVQRQAGIGFHTKIYRKDTFSGLITKWDSFVPKSYKYSAISSMAYRAMKICSTHQALHDEFEFIRNLSFKNGYPIAFVESVIRRQLNLVYEPREIKPPKPETDIVVLRVPYYGNPSHIYGKRVTTAVAAKYPLKQVRVVYDVTARIGHNFTTKDKIPTELRSGVVYEATCPVCNEKYIGETCRHLKTRINEHLSYQKKVMPPLTQPQRTTSITTAKPQKLIINSTFHMITRSQSRMNQQLLNQRKLLPKLSTILTRETKTTTVLNHNKVQKKVKITESKTKNITTIHKKLTDDEIDDILTNTTLVDKKTVNIIPKSAISKHSAATGHRFNNEDFGILLADYHRYRLIIIESLLIIKRNPKLNINERSMPLYIYPDGLSIAQKKETNQLPTTKQTTKGMYITTNSHISKILFSLVLHQQHTVSDQTTTTTKNPIQNK
ncbi:unnamed protein product [Rotaria socialis]|uniref:Reverse transcriptase domain-containing protein n=1 Tax=Rotaria socialis TaxID=392032 RepID=A0A817Q319_9BILA|nr:unnamed protein product [Rotaria socialis]CAF4508335.1 unnamed protein product [Rotaria socialis]